MHNMMFMLLLIQDTGVHALCNVCHVDVERISKRKPGELVHSETPCFLVVLFSISALTYVTVVSYLCLLLLIHVMVHKLYNSE